MQIGCQCGGNKISNVHVYHQQFEKIHDLYLPDEQAWLSQQEASDNLEDFRVGWEIIFGERKNIGK